jgi:hypothetical protein
MKRDIFKEITNSNETMDVLEANESVKSIIHWAKKTGLDRRQRRAFEITTATFLLTFFKRHQQVMHRGVRRFGIHS